jgi:hypothetical protein
MNESSAKSPEWRRHAKIEVEYFRGINGGTQGFWVRTRCPAEEIDTLTFAYQKTPEIPTDAQRIADNVMCFRDSTGEGISRLNATVTTRARETDYAFFDVKANVYAY